MVGDDDFSGFGFPVLDAPSILLSEFGIEGLPSRQMSLGEGVWSWDNLSEDEIDTYVYFMQEGGESGPIKIGISRNPYKRRSKLQTGNSKYIRLVAYRKGMRCDEDRLHYLFARDRERGEFFKLSQDLIDLLRDWFGEGII